MCKPTPVVVRGEEEKGVRWYAHGVMVYRKLMGLTLDKEYGDITDTDELLYGMIAQEVKEVIDNHPELKDGFDMWKEDDADGRQRIGEGSLIPMLVKAIQELSAEVTALKNA